MVTRGSSRYLLRKCVYLTLLVAVCATEETCNREKCPGPLRYYEELGCTPVYKNPGDCCAEKYDCSHLKELSKEKCYANGHVYEVGEALRDEDKNGCDIGCFCRIGNNGVASFICAAVDCGLIVPKDNCYNKRSHDRCCPGPYVCLEEGQKKPTCEVDGKIYEDGDYFQPESEPEKSCYCMEGYTGQNIEPFCRKPRCDPLFRRAPDVHQNCAPVFYIHQVPQKDCSIASRCQNANDTVIHNHDSTKSVSDAENDMCEFGNLKMHIGDELNQGTNYDSICVRCVCETPPVPTCRRLADNECQ
ncbi:kielin/chordin-like protein [Hylaeus volcanicus]|uniref:kielin/chordin-like protein n=1 Tax=Hylaeus volcanicus TaxID=313075 RepID=UPI0023B7DF78|nr:kielin/chordin-like protein [Hylaeus volcanicus]